jgi:FKBP-type peptidyl-prolyl cis-trans isomerase FklB
MKRTIIAFAGATLLAGQVLAADKPALTEQKDKVSYSIGLNIGSGMKREGLELNPELVAAGLKDAFTGATPRLTDEQVRETLIAFQKEMMAKQMEQAQAQAENAKVLGEKNRKEGEEFLAANKKKKGIKTLASGVQYEVLTEGKGPKPKASDTVKTHYRGTLIDGTEFDSSYKRNEPAVFPLEGVIPGWTEALQLMPVGSKWRLFLPSDKAYGENGAGEDIGPNSTLIFEVELLAIESSR